MTLAGFPHLDIRGSQFIWQLPAAYRSLSRPSSVSYVKASVMCAYVTFYALISLTSYWCLPIAVLPFVIFLIHIHPVMIYVSSCSKLLSYKLEQRKSARDSHFSSLHVYLRFFSRLKQTPRLDPYHSSKCGQQCKENIVATFTTILYLFFLVSAYAIFRTFGGR
jgi:hypothetical protein